MLFYDVLCCVVLQVLSKEYGPLVDIWSAGVIAYIILSGYPPFAGATDAQVLQRVKAGTYSFAAKEVCVCFTENETVGLCW